MTLAYHVAAAERRDELVGRLRHHIAYAARYGRQSVDLIEGRSVRWLLEFNKDLSDIVSEESEQRED